MTSMPPIVASATSPGRWPAIKPDVQRQQYIKQNLAALVLLFAAPDAKTRLEKIYATPTDTDAKVLVFALLPRIGKLVATLPAVQRAKVNTNVLCRLPKPGEKGWETFDPRAVAVVLGQLITKNDKGAKHLDCELAVLPALLKKRWYLEEPGRAMEVLGDLLLAELPQPSAFHDAESEWGRRPLPDSPLYAKRSRQWALAGLAATIGSKWHLSPVKTALAIAGAGMVLGSPFFTLPIGLLWGGLAAGVTIVATGALAVAGMAVFCRWAIAQARNGMTDAERALIDKGKAGPLTLRDFHECYDALACASGVDPAAPTAQPVAGYARRGRWQKLCDFETLVSWYAHARQGNPQTAWPHLMWPASMALMNRLKWQPHFVHLERLDAVRAAKAAGQKIIFVIHHESDLDTPAMLTVVGEFDPCTAAKAALTWTPAHGRIGTIHPNDPSRWSADASMERCLLVERQAERTAREKMAREALAEFDQGHSVAIFACGTRNRVAIPGQEFGSGVYKSTMMTIADAAKTRGDTVLFVPIHLVGTGSMMSSNYKRLVLGEGLGEHLPVIIGVGKPITFAALQERAGPLPPSTDDSALPRHYANALWLHAQPELIQLQFHYHEKLFADVTKVA